MQIYWFLLELFNVNSTLFNELCSELHIIIFFTDPKILKYHFMVPIPPIFEDSDYLFINSCFSVLTAYFHACLHVVFIVAYFQS